MKRKFKSNVTETSKFARKTFLAPTAAFMTLGKVEGGLTSKVGMPFFNFYFVATEDTPNLKGDFGAKQYAKHFFKATDELLENETAAWNPYNVLKRIADAAGKPDVYEKCYDELFANYEDNGDKVVPSEQAEIIQEHFEDLEFAAILEGEEQTTIMTNDSGVEREVTFISPSLHIWVKPEPATKEAKMIYKTFQKVIEKERYYYLSIAS